jgi:hypothetical protein
MPVPSASGLGRERLSQGYGNILSALQYAIELVSLHPPYQGDYLDHETFAQAMADHARRMDVMNAVAKEYEMITDHLDRPR